MQPRFASLFLTADLCRNIISSRISTRLPKRLTLSFLFFLRWPFLPAQSSCDTSVCSRTLSADFVLYPSRRVNLILQCFSEVITTQVVCHRHKLCLIKYYFVHSELTFSLNFHFLIKSIHRRRGLYFIPLKLN